MKWILIYVVVTSNGVTELQSGFVTKADCQQAATEIHLKYDSVALSVSTQCKHVDGQPVEVWNRG